MSSDPEQDELGRIARYLLGEASLGERRRMAHRIAEDAEARRCAREVRVILAASAERRRDAAMPDVDALARRLRCAIEQERARSERSVGFGRVSDGLWMRVRGRPKRWWRSPQN